MFLGNDNEAAILHGSGDARAEIERRREMPSESIHLTHCLPSSYPTLPNMAVFSSPSSAHITGPKYANFWNSSSLLVFILMLA